MQIIESLQSLGLNEKESKVYVALLQMGRSSAYAVSEKSGLKKPTTYVILGDLIEKGLATKVPRARKQLFAPRPPEEFFALAEERLALAKKSLPELMAMAAGDAPKVRSIFFEGMSGARQALWYRMKELAGTEIVGFYASAHDAPKEFIDLCFEWGDELAKRGVRLRGIAPVHPSLRRWQERYARDDYNFKFVPFEEYSATTSIDIGDTFVRIMGFKNLQSVIIENPDVARSARQIFEMLWKVRPEKANDTIEEKLNARDTIDGTL